ncbi:YicC family protein [Tumebacillus algifaecis]|uniref:YicC family protein n=1 Tax=Tumebacillus algifaecis TaxID=1214604 RepID=A0A223D1X6_9BACL|nr:YicC/YloC family endoribonuclease [Tumebacillus algifaecis]ASS75729.1 YicC family protein [Tumebacillus algifaecis]
MLKSMTGYGRAEATDYGYRVLVEIKAVNHRYAEVMVRMPRDYLMFEDGIKKVILERVSRGRLDCYITIEMTERRGSTVTFDEELAVHFKAVADSLAERLGMAERLSLADLLRQPDVVTVRQEESDPEQLGHLLMQLTAVAADDLVSMRQAEGARLAQDLVARIARLRELVGAVSVRSPLVVSDYRERLEKRLREALDGQAFTLDEARLLTEVAVLADRASIVEELVRLNSHCAQFREMIQGAEPIGRKLDFLVQEMNREVNTIGSKANDLQIAQHVVEMKALLEQVREQIQNVE